MIRHKLEDEALKQAIEISKIDIPQPAIQFEAEERERAFSTDMQKKGIEIKQFLKSNNITIEKMRELWLEDAKQALKTDVFLRTYINERNINISDEEFNIKVEDIKKNAPKETDFTIFENEQWKEYIKSIELKEKAFQSFMNEVLGDGKK